MTDLPTLTSLAFENRYEPRQHLWLDGPHGGWLAFDRVLRRDVILNIPYRSDDNNRFFETAQLRAGLRHTNLIPIYDFGVSQDGTPFFTEPHLQAIDLRELSKAEKSGNPLRILWNRLCFLLQASGALAFLHANDLLHLALTPQSVLITRTFKEVFLVGSLNALPLAKPQTENLSGIVAGVPAYLAPEQTDPDRLGPPTEATDVFGLGGILYYILFGDPPNQGTRPAEILELLSKRQGPPLPGNFQFTDSRSRNLSKKLETSCLRALESDPAKRQQNVKDFSNEIEEVLMGTSG